MVGGSRHKTLFDLTGSEQMCVCVWVGVLAYVCGLPEPDETVVMATRVTEELSVGCDRCRSGFD